MSHNIHLTLSDNKIKQLFEITCKIINKKQKDVIMDIIMDIYGKYEKERSKKRYERLG